MRRSNATTLTDVAKEAGVTAMTVSVVLNGSQSATRVSEQTRLRIQEAAARLRYRPNAVARGLSRRRMDTIGIVAITDYGEPNQYFAEMLNGILVGTSQTNQNATVFSIKSWTDDQQRILHFCDGRVDGMVLIAPTFDHSFAEVLARHTPVVSLHPNECIDDAFSISSDDEGGAYMMTKYLIEQGHRDILHLAGRGFLRGARLRSRGFQRAMKDAGIPITDRNIVEGNLNSTFGREYITELVAKRSTDPLPTAVFCMSDAIAYGCMEALSAAGLSVPSDISIAGFDDTLMARITQPPLSTIRQPFREMGVRAVEILIQHVHDDIASMPNSRLVATPVDPDLIVQRQEVFGVELVVRASVGPPPERK